ETLDVVAISRESESCLRKHLDGLRKVPCRGNMRPPFYSYPFSIFLRSLKRVFHNGATRRSMWASSSLNNSVSCHSLLGSSLITFNPILLYADRAFKRSKGDSV